MLWCRWFLNAPCIYARPVVSKAFTVDKSNISDKIMSYTLQKPFPADNFAKYKRKQTPSRNITLNIVSCFIIAPVS
jgi:hypothetical protein